MDDLENIETFVSVAKHLSFVKAAHVLNLRQPSVTARIKRLEERLGVQLFVRNKNHSIHLSEEGRVFLPFAQQMIRMMEEAENSVHNVRQLYEGTIRIGVTPSWTVDVLPRVLGVIRERYADIGFSVINGTTRSIYTMVLENQVDVGLVSYEVANQQVDCTQVHHTPWVLVCSQDHRFADKDELDVKDILHEPLVTYEQSTEGWRTIQRIYGGLGAVPNVVAQLEQLEAAKAMIAHSSCIGLLPKICVHQDLAQGRLAAVTVQQLQGVRTHMAVIALKAKSSYLMVKMFRHMIEEHFANWPEEV